MLFHKHPCPFAGNAGYQKADHIAYRIDTDAVKDRIGLQFYTDVSVRNVVVQKCCHKALHTVNTECVFGEPFNNHADELR